MQKVFGFALLVLGVVFSGSAEARSARCEGCSDTQFNQKAIELGKGRHVISSFSTNKIKMFDVFDGSGGEPGVPFFLVASPVAVPADIKAVFDDARSFWALTNGTMKLMGVVIWADEIDGVPGLDGKTAFDVIRDVNLRGRLGDRLGTGALPGFANLERAGEQIVQGVFAKVGMGDASIEIIVKFRDGSTVVYRLETNAGTGQYQEGKSRTADGEVIPEANSSGNQGTWYGPTGLASLGDHLVGLGAKMTYVGSGGWNRISSIVCVWDAKGQQLICKVYTYTY